VRIIGRSGLKQCFGSAVACQQTREGQFQKRRNKHTLVLSQNWTSRAGFSLSGGAEYRNVVDTCIGGATDWWLLM